MLVIYYMKHMLYEYTYIMVPDKALYIKLYIHVFLDEILFKSLLVWLRSTRGWPWTKKVNFRIEADEEKHEFCKP
jgi:hypothetical protein